MFQAAMEEFAPEWFLKVEDNVYVSPSHALAALPQWGAMGVEYVGCLAHDRHVDWKMLDGIKVWPHTSCATNHAEQPCPDALACPHHRIHCVRLWLCSRSPLSIADLLFAGRSAGGTRCSCMHQHVVAAPAWA